MLRPVDFKYRMPTPKSTGRSRAVWALARQQHGVVTHADLRELGFSPQTIKRRLASGRLHRVYRGVYAVGAPRLTREGRWMAAVLACGEDAALSHRSAGTLWGIVVDKPRPIDVSVLRRSEHRKAGIRAKSRPSMAGEDVTRRHGIPVTTIARTLIDLATELSEAALERAVNEADKQDHIDPEALRDSLGRYGGEPGVKKLRTLLDRHTFKLSDSELESRFRTLAASAGLPPPLTKHWLDGFEIDFYWPELDLVVETDGIRYHRTPAAQARDRRRDQTHTAAGRTMLRFTHCQVAYERKRTATLLVKAARLARARQGSADSGRGGARLPA